MVIVNLLILKKKITGQANINNRKDVPLPFIESLKSL